MTEKVKLQKVGDQTPSLRVTIPGQYREKWLDAYRLDPDDAEYVDVDYRDGVLILTPSVADEVGPGTLEMDSEDYSIPEVHAATQSAIMAGADRLRITDTDEDFWNEIVDIYWRNTEIDLQDRTLVFDHYTSDYQKAARGRYRGVFSRAIGFADQTWDRKRGSLEELLEREMCNGDIFRAFYHREAGPLPIRTEKQHASAEDIDELREAALEGLKFYQNASDSGELLEEIPHDWKAKLEQTFWSSDADIENVEELTSEVNDLESTIGQDQSVESQRALAAGRALENLYSMVRISTRITDFNDQNGLENRKIDFNEQT